MELTGIVAEYNPFHNGHQYHLTQTNALQQADGIVAVMSGCFTSEEKRLYLINGRGPRWHCAAV